MDIISLALSKKYTNLIGSGISSITAVGNNIHFVTTSLTEFDITLPYSVHEHTNLNTILEKLTLDGNGNLLFDGNAISSGSTINYLDLINKPTINGVEITGSKSLSDLGVQPTIVSGTASQYYRGDKTFQTLDKTTVGLANIDNTSDVNKPISTATQTALNLKVDTSSINTSLGNKVDKIVGSSLVVDTEISKIHTHANKATIDGITSENITSWTGKAEVSAIPTTTSQLTNNSNFAVDSSYVHTDNNYTTDEKTKVGKITTTGDGSKYLNDAGNYITVSGGSGGASIDDISASLTTTYSSTKISTDYATKTELNGKVDDGQVLTDVPVGAVFTDTVYTHPANHSPSIITQDSSNRFTTDAEKTSWNSASTNSHTHTNKTVLDNTTASYTTTEQTKLSNILGTNTGDETATTIINKIGSPKLFHGIESRSVGATNPLPAHITTSTFTLSTGINPIVYYYRGSKITVSVDKTVVLGTSGLYYISFINSTGNIQASTSPTGVLYTSDVIIATVMWNGTNYGLVNDERHSYDRDAKWHLWAHRTVGTRYSSGITLTHNGGTGVGATFATTSGDIYDEDIQFIVDAQTTCRTLYQTSATTHAFDSVLSTTPFKLGTGNRPVMVRDTDYSLITLSSATNRYINVFVYATTDLLNPIYMITETVSATVSGTNGYTSLALARTSPFPNMSNKGISEELRPIYRLIVRADGLVQAIDTTQDDYRTVSSLPLGAGTTSTTASATNFTASGNISATTVQGALEELDSEKVDKETGKSLVSDTEITRLGGLSNYTLPVATTTIGGVKSGTDITVDVSGNVSVNDDSHNHTISTVTGLQTALDGKIDDGQVLTDVPVGALFTDTTYSAFTPTTDGLAPLSGGGTTKYLRADGSWAIPPNSGTGGSIVEDSTTNGNILIDGVETIVYTQSEITKSDIGLSNVDNTSDIAKPISMSTQSALDLKVDKETGKSLVLDTDLTTLNGHVISITNPHSVTKAQIGLEDVDNTSDSSKPISILTQTALDLKSDITYVDTQLGNKVDKIAGSSLVADTTLSTLNGHVVSTTNPHSTSLSQLADVNVVSPTDKQELIYDTATSKWINANASIDVDEKVKATSGSSSSKYLNELIDNDTITMTDDKLIVQSVSGVTHAELLTLVGMDTNIKTTLTALASAGMTFKGVKNTKAELNAITGMLTGELYIVKVDESQSNLKTSYIYDGATWVSLGESSVNVRDFTVNKIDLTSEVKNILPKANMDLTGIATTTDLANYTTTTSLSTNYALKTDLTAKANTSDIYTKIQSDTNYVAKVANKSVVLDTEIAKIHSHANKTILDNTTASYTTAEQTKLSGIATSANNYTHPANHLPSIITQDSSNRFVTDAEKTTWNGKATQSNIDNSINNIKIGGRNYIRKNSLVSYTPYNTTPIWDENTKTISTTMTTVNTTMFTLGYGYVPSAGTYTVSGIFKRNGNPVTNSIWTNKKALAWVGSLIHFYLDDSTGYFEITQNWDGASSWLFDTYIPTGTIIGDVLSFTNLKFEKGNKVTDWTPAIEDIDNSINAKLPLIGGTITGDVTINNNIGLYSKNAIGTSLRMAILNASNQFILGANTIPTYIYSSINPVCYVGSNPYVMYHEGNKPTKSDLTLNNVDNTTDLLKPISTATQTALNLKVNTSQVLTNVPSGAIFTDTVTTVNGKTGAIAKSDIVALGIPAQDTTYSVATQSVSGLISSTDKTKLDGIATASTKVAGSLTNGNIKINDVETIIYTHPTGTNPHGTTKADIGLNNVDNTSDINKPISTATQTSLDDVNTKLITRSRLLSSNLGCPAPKYAQYGFTNKKYFELRNISEFDATSNIKCTLGTLGVITASSDGRCVYALKDGTTTNLTCQAKMYWNATQMTSKIGYSEGTLGVLPSGKDIDVGFKASGFIYNNGTTEEVLVTPANLTTGWYLVTFCINKTSGTCIISIQNDAINVTSFVRSTIPTNISIVNAFIEAYGANDLIRDLKYTYNNSADLNILPSVILNTNNYHTPLQVTVSGVTTVIHYPANYNPYIKNKCIIFFHGAGGESKNLWGSNNIEAVITKPLLDAGYVIIASDCTNVSSWGNSQSVTDITNLVNYYQTHANIQNDYYVVAISMGGIVSLNSITHDSFKPKAYVGIYPVSNLYDMYKNSPAPTPANIMTAYGITGDADFESKTVGYDPSNDIDAKVFKDIPFLLWSSYSDTVVSRINNTDKFATQVNAIGGNVTVKTSIGNHGDTSNFVPQDIIDFFAKY